MPKKTHTGRPQYAEGGAGGKGILLQGVTGGKEGRARVSLYREKAFGEKDEGGDCGSPRRDFGDNCTRMQVFGALEGGKILIPEEKKKNGGAGGGLPGERLSACRKEKKVPLPERKKTKNRLAPGNPGGKKRREDHRKLIRQKIHGERSCQINGPLQ